MLEPKNAALLAAKIFSLFDEKIAEAVKKHLELNAEKIIDDDKKIRVH